MRVTVVMPVRDAASTVVDAARSILDGSMRDIELVCVDDGSRDETPELLARLAASDARVRVLEQEPAGIVAALERGWRAARAPLIARMDADDRAYPERLRRQVELLDARPELGLVGCRVRIVGSAAGAGMERYERWSNALCEPEEIHRERFVESPMVHPTWLVRRSVLEASGGYRDEVPGPEDYDLLLRLLGAGVRAAKVPEVLLDWRDEPDRLTRRDPRCADEAMLRLKVLHLLAGPLSRGRPYAIVGAGVSGKRLCRALVGAGHGPVAFIDKSSRRVGRRIDGIPVWGLEELGGERCRPLMLLLGVAQPRARREVQELMDALGRRLPEDALFAA